MTHKTYTELLTSISKAADNTQTVHIPENWMQGRTTYGGLTAALCHEAAAPLAGGRPLRCAQIAFVGPVNGDVVSTPTVLREGKNSVFVSVRMTGDTGVAADAIFTFGAARESKLAFTHIPMHDVPAPEDIPPPPASTNQRTPTFFSNFDTRFAAGGVPMMGGKDADVSLWMRHKERDVPMNATALLAIGDAPPPAVLAMFTQPGRVSSMTWMAEFLTDEITTDDGWFLARHIGEAANHGYCSQAQTLWNRKGEPIMIGRQTIAIFD